MIDAIETDLAGTEGQIIKLINNIDESVFDCYLSLFKNSDWITRNKNLCDMFIAGSTSFHKLKFYTGLIKLFDYIRDKKIDIVIAYFPTSITIGVLTAKIAGVKYIVSSRRDMGFWRTRSLCNLLKFSNRYVTRFLVNSNVVKYNLIEKEKVDPARIDVIYNGLEMPSIKTDTKSYVRNVLDLQENNIVVGTVANLNREVKRIDVFIKSAKIISEKHPNVKFVIVGDGHLREKYTELARNLCVDGKIIFAGSVRNPLDYASVFDIAVNSSDSEGFSNAVLEYSALGIPTVATDVGGNSEVIRDMETGILVPAANPDLMAEKILYLIEQKPLRDELGEKAKNRMGEFSLSNMIARHETYFKNLIHGDTKS
jgi:glycosyltransferase involved in cell wall biosynthesis